MSEKKKKKLLPFVVIFAIAGIAFVISGFLIGCVKGENKSLIQTVIANGSCDETYNKEPYNIYRQATEEQVSINIADNGDYYSSVNSADSFCITVLDVGQGLSVMIICDGETALFDAGGPSENSDKYISSLLGSGFIDFKYCFISHYDADHCNYMNGVMETCSIGTLILPDYEANTKTYSSMIRHRDENGIPYEYAQVGTTYELGEADITVIGPNGYDHENENNNSICIRINYGNISAVITGDAESEAEEEMISNNLDFLLDCDIYIVGHHGSFSSSTDAFLEAMSPKYAAISVGYDNDYGHPSGNVLKALETIGTDIYRTDIDGQITFVSDGNNIKISTEK